MVYRGRPSTGCSRCRTRKIKCDERPDGCIKCAEKGFTCPGYDRTVDAFFLDETAKVKSKAKISNAKAMAARESRDNQELALLVRSNSPSVHLIAPLLDQGLNYFLKHHTVGLDQPPISSKAYQQHLSTDGFHPLVATTMTALGIAGVANLYRDPRLEKEAMRCYLNAIKMANAAISSPEEVRKDTTLISVNLLSFFEATFNDSSLMGWSNHVDGAAMLVKMRGQGQFATPAGRRMYLHTIAMLTMNCMGKGIAMPDYVRDLNDEIMGYLDNEDPRNAFFFLHIKANNLRAEIFKNKNMDLRDIVDRALELDTIAASIFKDIGKEWRYDIVPKSGNMPHIYGDSYHVYPSHPAAQTWNWVRYNRIYFHDIIRNCILAGLTQSPPVLTGTKYLQLIEKSTQTLQQMQSDILASMPQFLHDTPKVAPRMMVQTGTIDPMSIPLVEYYQDPVNSILLSPPDTPGSHTSYYPSPTPDPNPSRKAIYTNFLNDTLEPAMRIDKSTIRDQLPIVRVSGGYSTIWALYVAGSMPTASTQSQDFVLQCFKRIESEFGIKQARVLGNALRLKRRLPNQGEVVGQLCPEYLPPDEPVVPWTPQEGEAEAIPHPLARNEGISAMDEIDAAIYGNTVDDFGQMV